MDRNIIIIFYQETVPNKISPVPFIVKALYSNSKIFSLKVLQSKIRCDFTKIDDHKSTNLLSLL